MGTARDIAKVRWVPRLPGEGRAWVDGEDDDETSTTGAASYAREAEESTKRYNELVAALARRRPSSQTFAPPLRDTGPHNDSPTRSPPARDAKTSTQRVGDGRGKK